MKCRLILVSLALVAPLSSGAQQLNQPQPIERLQASGGSGSGSGNSLPAPEPGRNTSVRQDASQRADTPKVVSETGIKPVHVVQPTSTRPGEPTKPIRVTDARGVPVPGAVQVGPNRVMDPNTGRVYMTVPNGDGQRIVDPSRK